MASVANRHRPPRWRRCANSPRAGKIDREAVVVAILTGHALKDTDFIIKSQPLESACTSGRVQSHERRRLQPALTESEREEAFEIKVPASIANLGPGFDTLAVAVQLYLRLRVESMPGRGELEFRFVGQQLCGENYIERAFRFLARAESLVPSVLVGGGAQRNSHASRTGQQRGRHRCWSAAV